MPDYSTRSLMLACVVAVAATLASCGQPSPAKLLDAAKASQQSGDDKAAIIHLKAALQQNPRLAEARFLLGQSLLNSGDAIAAIVELEKALELKHPEDDVHPALALALVQSGQAKKATDRYSHVRLQGPVAHARLKSTLAAAFGAQGLVERSQAFVDAALQLDPSNRVARLLRARLPAGRGEMDAALQQLNTLIAEKADDKEAWHLKGEVLWMGKSDLAGGTAAFRKTLEIEPRYLPAHRSLIQMALRAQDLPAFKSQAAKLNELLPRHPEAMLYKAQSALVDKDYKTTREIVQQLLRLAPDSPQVLQLAGTLEFSAGSAVVAETHLVKALQFEPRLPAARRLLSQVYLRTGQAAKALSTLQPLLDQDPPSAEALAAAAEASLMNGQPAQADELYGRAARLAPNDTKIQTALALTQIARGDAAAGLADLESMAARANSTTADMALISSLLRRNDTGGALKALDRLQGKLPASAMPHQLRGRIMLQRKDTAAARASFEKALAVDANYYAAVASLAALDLADNNVAMAIRRFDEQLQRDPKNYHALTAVAELRLQSGAPPDAVRALLAQAVKAAPGEATPHALLIDFLLLQRDYSSARAAAQAANSAVPGNPQLIDALGRVQLATGEVQQAINTFGRVATAQPGSVNAQLRLAEAHAQNKDKAAAKRSLQRALELDPKALPAQRGLVQLALSDGRFDDALTIARKVQQQRPREGVGYALEGELFASRRQWEPALAAMRSALNRDKSTPSAIQVHALMTVANMASTADAFASQWLREQPKDVAFLGHLGTLDMGAGKFGPAEQRFRAILALQPDNATALNNLAWILVQQKKSGALELARRANTLAPDRPAFMDTLAVTLAAEGDLPGAVEWQRKAVGKADPAAAPTYRLGLAKLLLQNRDAANARTELEALTKLGDKFAGQAEVTALLASIK